VALPAAGIERVYVDKGHRGHKRNAHAASFIFSGQKRGAVGVIKRELRRSAIEPVIVT
jgi:hypothetical protein